MGVPIAWKAGSHLAIVLKTNIELLSVVGLNFVSGEFTVDHKLPVVRIQSKYLHTFIFILKFCYNFVFRLVYFIIYH